MRIKGSPSEVLAVDAHTCVSSDDVDAVDVHPAFSSLAILQSCIPIADYHTMRVRTYSALCAFEPSRDVFPRCQMVTLIGSSRASLADWNGVS